MLSVDVEVVAPVVPCHVGTPAAVRGDVGGLLRARRARDWCPRDWPARRGRPVGEGPLAIDVRSTSRDTSPVLPNNERAAFPVGRNVIGSLEVGQRSQRQAL